MCFAQSFEADLEEKLVFSELHSSNVLVNPFENGLETSQNLNEAAVDNMKMSEKQLVCKEVILSL